MGSEHAARDKSAGRERDAGREVEPGRDRGSTEDAAGLTARARGACRACGCGMPCGAHGERLDGATAARMSAALGERFDDVQIHTGREASAIARQHGALAVSAGREIAFADGAFQPGTLAGDALLAHELAHVAEQRGARGEFPATLTEDAHAEASADHAAVGFIGQALGFFRGVGARAAAGGGRMQLRACKDGSALSTSQRATADLAASSTFGSNPALQRLYSSSYGPSDLRVGNTGGNDANTSSGTTVLSQTAVGYGAPRLGALLLHEMSHLRDGSNAMGSRDAVEGFAYAFEISSLQRSLERHHSGVQPLPAAQVAEAEDRIRTIGRLYATPPTLPALAPAYRENFDGMLGAVQALNRIADGQTVTWGPSGAPPQLAGLTPTQAQERIARLLTVSSSTLSGTSDDAQLLRWMRAHESELPWAGLSGALAVLPRPATP